MASTLVIIVAARKFDKYASFLADRPSVMTWREKHDVVLSKSHLLAIVHTNTERPGKHQCDMWQDTTFSAMRSLEIIGPFRTDIEGDARHRHTFKFDGLLADEAVDIRLDRIQASDLHKWIECHFDFPVIIEHRPAQHIDRLHADTLIVRASVIEQIRQMPQGACSTSSGTEIADVLEVA